MSKIARHAIGYPPRPEYPEPQFARPAWVSLNGSWEFDFDDGDAGLDAGWHLPGRTLGRNILVPFCFECEASRIADPSPHPVCWYRRRFRIPEEWAGRRVLLRFGAVDYRAQVWVNGCAAGEHEGGQTPFSFDITALLQAGENTLAIRVDDPPRDRSIPRGKQYWKDKPEAIWYTRTSGVWQSVWLEAAGPSYLDAVRITASHEGRVEFEPSVARFAPGLTFDVRIGFGGEEIWRGSAGLRQPWTTLATLVEGCEPWSPEHPNLYDVEFELRRDGAVVDRVHSYFGFRSVEVRQGRLYLNNAPLQLRFVLDQGYWPETLLTPPSDEAIRYDIQMAKELGFNGVRKHQKVEDPRFLYWADRIGLLVSGEIGNAYAFTSGAVSRLTAEWTAAVRRDYNHPSIVMWIPVNESWGVPDLKDPRQQNLLRGMYALTKSLDATRLVIDNDGWEHTETTDLFGLHDYAPSGALLARKYAEDITATGNVPPIARPAVVPGARYNGSPLFLSEFGGVAYRPPHTDVPEGSWGYFGVEAEYQDAIRRIKDLIGAASRIEGCAGYCYTQLTDVEQEINGLLTYDRVVKFDPREIRQAMDAAPPAEPEAAPSEVPAAVAKA
ncbi:MAG: beta galactosidase jelly roll domain-containing protein [Bryobacteraceae bacterium]|nr:beta galactosidase jelly roll domain-containing protein [Bryobacteraceae bacterium]